MRDLALRLAESGHGVTYLTMRHWSTHAPPSLPGVRLFGLTAPGRIYDQEGRTLGPPLRFGFAVGRHLFRHRGDYDVVHIASFPYFPLLAAGALRRRGRYRLFVDWHEVWSLAYWRRYAGSVVGTIGWLVQRRCLRLPQRAFCFSQMNAARVVVEAAARGTPSVVVAGPENAATELVRDGVNGAIAADASPEPLAEALLRVIDAGGALRASTARWFAEKAAALSLEGSL